MTIKNIPPKEDGAINKQIIANNIHNIISRVRKEKNNEKGSRV